MDDPFSALLKSLKPIFRLEATRNGKYIYPKVQQLKEAVENYNPEKQSTFIHLLKAIKESILRIEKWRINFDSIRKPIDALAKIHEISPSIVSTRFQFSAHNHPAQEVGLSTWLTARTGKSFFQMEPNEITQVLIANGDRPGFSQKLSSYLKKYPDFLFHLIMDSKKNFIKICHNRLVLYLTDKQIADAIIEHIPDLVNKKAPFFEQVEQLIYTLNDILSNGRSVSTLLRNAKAEPILSKSVLFRTYKHEHHAKRQTHSAPEDNYPESELLKPD